MFKRVLLLLLIAIVLFSIVGCGEENDSEENDTMLEEEQESEDNGYIHEFVETETSLPSPDEVGAEYVDPSEGETIEGSEWTVFWEKWNEVAQEVSAPNLRVNEEVEVLFVDPRMMFDYEITNYLNVYGDICYKTNELEHVGVDWELGSEVDGSLIAASWYTLVNAAHPEKAEEEITGILEELGIYDVSPQDITEHDMITVMDDIEYDFYSTETMGYFELWADPID